jgi:hypothetical protein
LGDTVVFSNGETAEITELDAECPNGLTISCTIGDEEPYFRNDGVIESGFKDTELGDYRIVTAGNQTLLRFELGGPPTSGLFVSESGKALSWSTPQAGGGSYRIKKEDVGKQVETRSGERYIIIDWDEGSGWPVWVGSDPEDSMPYFTVTSYGQCSSDIRDADGFAADQDEDRDIVRIYH